MPTTTRKQREIQQREQNIYAVARRKLVEGGYHGLNMDAIANELEYSKGTIYNHFPCKEEIILALAIETMNVRTEMFERAASFSGLPRERMAAIGVAAEMFVKLFPDHFHVEQLIRANSIWEKTSEKRQNLMRSCETRCMGIVSGIIRDGIAQGHVSLPDDTSPEDVVFGLWSQTFGAYSIITTSDSLQELGVADPFLAVRRATLTVLDGYRWSPLSTDYNYFDLFEKLEREVFANEYREAVTP